jgi:hypothetical protein
LRAIGTGALYRRSRRPKGRISINDLTVLSREMILPPRRPTGIATMWFSQQVMISPSRPSNHLRGLHYAIVVA